MPKTIRQLREDRGESTMQLAEALGTTLQDIHDLESGVASPSAAQLRRLARHFGVRKEAINLEPDRSPTVGDQVREALSE
jgi:transcriptional regulator with XRE-family HTH domain